MAENTLQKLLESAGDDELSEQMFTVLFNTLLELNVKKVILSDNDRIFSHYKLMQYGLKRLSGQLDQSNGDEWMAAIDRVEQIFLEIHCRNTADFGDVDGEFLFRLLLIHNELMGLKDVEELKIMPLQKMQFCLSIFLLIFEHRSKYDVYALLLNQRNMMAFLTATCDDLRVIRNKKRNCDAPEGCELTSLVYRKDSKIFRKLDNVYEVIRSLHLAYSLQNDISSILSEKLSETVLTASLNALLIKFEQTQDWIQDKSSNLSKQLKSIIDAQKKITEDTKSMNDEIIMHREKIFYERLHDSLPVLNVLIKLFIFMRVHSAFRQFLRSARGCQSVQTFQSCCSYVKTLEDLSNCHCKILEEIIEFYSELEQSSREDERISLKNRALHLLTNMKTGMACFHPTHIGRLGEKIRDLEKMRTRIDADIAFLGDPTVLECIHGLWHFIESEMLPSFDPGTFFEEEELYIRDQSSPDVAENNTCMEKAEDKSSPSRQSPSFDELIETWSKLASEADLIFRNKFFEEYIDNIRSTLAQYDCLSIETFICNHHHIPRPVAAALRYWQLQCYDFLERQNLTGSGSELVKMGSAIVFGKQFQNYLQSDDPSYHVVMHDPTSVVLLHGLLLVKSPYEELQHQHCVIPEGLYDVRVEGWNWIQLQKQLVHSDDFRKEPILNMSCGETYRKIIELTEDAHVSSLRRLLARERSFTPDETLLLEAISTGNEEIFSILIHRLPNIGENIIQQAITANMIHPIISHLQNVNRKFMGQALHMAVRANTVEVVRTILNTEQTWTNREQLNETLRLAVRYNRIGVVRLLLPHMQMSSELDSAMFTAASQKRWKLAKLLLAHGANPHASISSGGSPLKTTFQQAVAADCLKFVKRCDAQAEQNRRSSGLLSLAASIGSLRMAEHLLGVGFDILDDDHVLPVVLQFGHVHIQRMVLDRLRVLEWVNPVNEFARWLNLIEQCKMFDYLMRFVKNVVFNNASDWFTRTVVRKIKLLGALDKDFYVRNVEKSLEDWRVIHTILKNVSSAMKQRLCDVHIYDQNRAYYSYIKLIVFDAEDISESETQTHELFLTNEDTPISYTRLGIQHILAKLQLEPAFYSCDIHCFPDDTRLRRFKLLQLESTYCFVEFDSRFLNSADFLSEKVRSIAEVVSKESRIHLSVGLVDIECTAFLLKQFGHPGYEDIWLDPLVMHTLVDSDETKLKQKIDLADVLLDAGVNCWSVTHPTLAQSCVDYALTKQQKPLAAFLLTRQCAGLSTFESFRSIIQYGSIDTFKLFLEMGNYNETEIFEHTSNVLLEFNVKHVSFSSDLYTYILYRLARYGFANLCADSNAPKYPLEWLESIKLISESVEILSSRKDRDYFLGVDNEVLFHLRMIHNHLFFIKDCVQLRQIPLKQMTFLLAIFLSIFKSSPEDGGKRDSFATFRVILNKPELMHFLIHLSSQLNGFREEFLRVSTRMEDIIVEHNDTRDKNHLKSIWDEDRSLPNLSDNVWNNLTSKKKAKLPPRELVPVVFSSEFINFQWKKPKQHKHVLRRLTRLYQRVKQLYSLGKVFNVAANFAPAAGSKQVTVACMKRFIQIFGECIKSSANSQNLPSKLNNILEKQLSTYIQYNKQTRDVSCHDFPLARKFFRSKINICITRQR
ncbi:uncharacterized protein LOC129780611 [Toxorhynchites rutilus septentrionalis]|uniref:uncharacterized protein LOC129780611 n=1 Tax=Toxorhynchites rutilus septentrionalis TaxID=329112 RepID=UPI002478F1E4|nr:uncharacterized protein LOC129780611 [Toxorhynchites rutilus septentrionalis]